MEALMVGLTLLALFGLLLFLCWACYKWILFVSFRHQLLQEDGHVDSLLTRHNQLQSIEREIDALLEQRLAIIDPLIARFSEHQEEEKEAIQRLLALRDRIRALTPENATFRGFYEAELRDQGLRPMLAAAYKYPSLRDDEAIVAWGHTLIKIDATLLALAEQQQQAYHAYMKFYKNPLARKTIERRGLKEAYIFIYNHTGYIPPAGEPAYIDSSKKKR